MELEGRPDPSRVSSFQERIIEYWDKNGRHDLPWRDTRNPWKLLLSEFLLRKTTSKQATDVYNRISGLGPEDIIGLTEGELIEILAPLGMQKVKARQLKEVAERVSETGPRALENRQDLMTLPGVGRYIANTVLCFSRGDPEPALDTNMIRVLIRVFGVQSKRARARDDRAFWDFAETLVPEARPREYNWGVLDLAAQVCKHTKPLCTSCPLTDICVYYQNLQESGD